MDTASNGKEINLNRIDFYRMTAQERMLYGSKIRDLRKNVGMKQEELAEAANVTRRTIGNLELGKVAGQADVLTRIYRALGQSIAGELEYSPETQTWLAVLGPLIDKLPDNRRNDVMQETVMRMAVEISGTSPSNVTPLRKNVDLHTVDLSQFEGAADEKPDSTPNPDDHTP